MATSLPSSVPTYTLSFHTATPRLTTSQQARLPQARGTLGSNCHSSFPVFASSASTMLHGSVVNMTPLTTTGVASRPLRVPVGNSHANPNACTLPVWICASGE